MPAKASAGTEFIPMSERSSKLPCVGQEPDRTSGAPLESPVKLQPPNPTVQGKAEELLDAVRSPSSASNIFLDPDVAMLDYWRRCLPRHFLVVIFFFFIFLVKRKKIFSREENS